MISNGKQYDNRYMAGHQAVERGDWRMAYDCFRDCSEYLKYYEPWREDEIAKLGVLIEQCRAMFI